MARKNDHFSESELIHALRTIARQQEENSGSMVLWNDAENIRRLRDACRQVPDKSVIDVAGEMASCFEVL
jgi:hypothetical protein